MNTICIIYFIGCILAFVCLLKSYRESKANNEDCSEACLGFTFGTILSWITVIFFIWYRYLKNNNWL